MDTTIPDVIDRLAGIEPGSRLDEIRAQRPEARQNAQKSYLALFQPDGGYDEVTAQERHVLAAFVAGLHREPSIAEFYATSVADPDGQLAAALSEEVFRGATQGPYGRYPEGPLDVEDKEGLAYRVLDAHRGLLGQRLAAAFEHAHLLVFRPRDASPAALRELLDAGWSTTGIVTLSQLVTFLSFQLRVVTGLRVLDAA
jgi:CMD domain protein